MTKSESTSRMSGKSDKKLRKENLNPGEAKSVMDYKCQSSVKLETRSSVSESLSPRTPRRNDRSISSLGHISRDIGSSGAVPQDIGSPLQAKKSLSVSELPGPLWTNRKIGRENKKENLDPGIRIQNGNTPHFDPPDRGTEPEPHCVRPIFPVILVPVTLQINVLDLPGKKRKKLNS